MSIHPTLPLHPSQPSPRWASWAIEQLPTSCLVYTRWCIYVSATLSVRPPPPLPPMSTLHSLPLCLYSCPAEFHQYHFSRFHTAFYELKSGPEVWPTATQVPVGARVLFAIIVWCGLCVVKGTYRRIRLESCLKWLEESRGEEVRTCEHLIRVWVLKYHLYTLWILVSLTYSKLLIHISHYYW